MEEVACHLRCHTRIDANHRRILVQESHQNRISIRSAVGESDSQYAVVVIQPDGVGVFGVVPADREDGLVARAEGAIQRTGRGERGVSHIIIRTRDKTQFEKNH